MAAPRATRRARRGPAVCCACLLIFAATAQAADTPDPAVLRDPVDARDGAPDLTRVQIGLNGERRLRIAMTLSAGWVARNLLASEGPPGSICARLWTVTRPGAAAPDYLACVTAHRDGETLRGSVFKQEAGKGMTRVTSAVVGRTSDRTVTLRFSQSAIGRPATIRFAAEATKAGCARVSCVDTAPDAPKTATFRVRDRA